YYDYGYTPYSYRRYFDRFHVGFYDPYWDPWYYDPYVDFSFSIGWGRPWHRWNSWHHPYSYAYSPYYYNPYYYGGYVYGPSYGWRYHGDRNITGTYTPRGSTL